MIVLTHGHLDHVGAAAELAKQLNIPIVGPHPDEINFGWTIWTARPVG